MAFTLRVDESVVDGIKRIVRKEIDQSLEALADQDGKDRDAAVHNARKRFKKVRAVLRLIRPELSSRVYRRENRCFRDAGRPLTEVRDAHVLLDTLDKLAERFPDQLSPAALSPAREALRANQDAIRHRVLEQEDAVAHVTASLEEARRRVKRWDLDHEGWRALERGLKRVYREGRRAFERALAEPTVENWHEWRKQVKYLWHHLQVLQPLWLDLLEGLADQAHHLADDLGQDHDLAVLREFVEQDPGRCGDEHTVAKLLELIEWRRGELRQQAKDLGQRLYGERPRDFVGRLASHWNAWRSQDGALRTDD